MQGARRTEYAGYFNFFIVSLWKRSVCRVWVGQAHWYRWQDNIGAPGWKFAQEVAIPVYVSEKGHTAEVPAAGSVDPEK